MNKKLIISLFTICLIWSTSAFAELKDDDVEFRGNMVVLKWNANLDHTIPLSGIALVGRDRQAKKYWINYYGYDGGGGITTFNITKAAYEKLMRKLSRFEE